MPRSLCPILSAPAFLVRSRTFARVILVGIAFDFSVRRGCHEKYATRAAGKLSSCPICLSVSYVMHRSNPCNRHHLS
jgi:hypothetical protein